MESRTDLLSWLNRTFSLNYTRIEQMGTGSAYCQIMDAIYGDVPMSKVNFEANQEYMYVNNFKILQNTFKQHNLDKCIPVDRLIKCKFQDNLEFFQWMKKFFDANYPGSDYDAIARRKSKGTTVTKTQPLVLNIAPVRNTVPPMETLTKKLHSTSLNENIVPNVPPVQKSTSFTNDIKKIEELNSQLKELRESVTELEEERDFYFKKLRDIEICCQNEEDSIPTSELRKKIREILYNTEEGFEIPNDDVVHPLEDETF
jgi:RP/EB family microtubule-associated protein